jgi:hypothetical protein
MSDAPGPDAAFGAALYRLLAADCADLVFSPASIGAALRMALCGARADGGRDRDGPGPRTGISRCCCPTAAAGSR